MERATLDVDLGQRYRRLSRKQLQSKGEVTESKEKDTETSASSVASKLKPSLGIL
jgi:hypothetical protein